MKEHAGLALAVAIGAVTFFVLMPVLIVVLVYLFGTVYTIAKALGVGGRSPNAGTILVGVVLIVSTLVLLLALGMAAIGRIMEPKKRTDRSAA